MIYDIVFKLGFSMKYLEKNTNIMFQKMGERIKSRNITITNSPVQTIHEISL